MLIFSILDISLSEKKKNHINSLNSMTKVACNSLQAEVTCQVLTSSHISMLKPLNDFIMQRLYCFKLADLYGPFEHIYGGQSWHHTRQTLLSN